MDTGQTDERTSYDNIVVKNKSQTTNLTSLVCNKIINKDLSSTRTCCYITFWNVKNRKTSNNL